MELKKLTFLRPVAGDDTLAKIPFAKVSVYVAGSNFSTLAEGIKNADGGLENPLTTDFNGVVRIAAPNGTYDVRCAPEDEPPLDSRETWADIGEQSAAAVAAAATVEGLAPIVQGYAEQVIDLAPPAIEAAGVATAAAASAVAGMFLPNPNTKAVLDANLAFAAGTGARVLADPTPGNNGYYVKTGASGAGAWTYVGADPVAAEAALRQSGDGTVLQTVRQNFRPTLARGSAIADAYGLAALLVGEDGIIHMNAVAQVIAERLGITGAMTYTGDSWVFTDAYGLTICKISAAGVESPNINALAARVESRLAYVGHWPFERFIDDVYGQSLGNGHNSIPSLSTTQPYNSLMLSGGVRTWLSSASIATQTLVPLVEADVNPDDAGGDGGETPVAGSAQFINELIAAENGLTYSQNAYQAVGMSSAKGSTAIAALSKPTANYTKRMDAIDRILTLCDADNTYCGLPAFSFVHGESDIVAATSRATYKAAYKQMRVDTDTDMKARVAGHPDVHMIGSQVSSASKWLGSNPSAGNHDIALAQWEASQEEPLIHLSNPQYFFDFATDGVHLTNSSSKWQGAYLGLVHKRIVVDAGAWAPLQPSAKAVRGKVCEITFDVPVGPLVFDTTWVSDPGNYGFELVDSLGAPLTISSVALLGPDRVKITADATIPAGATVRYAFSPTVGGPSAGRLTGPRGCLRDSQGDSLVFDPDGINRPMHNWCVIFSI